MMRHGAPRLVQRVDHVTARVAHEKVLHLGCADWPYTTQALANGTLLHHALLCSAAELWGSDADLDGLRALARGGVTRLFPADLEALGQPLRMLDGRPMHERFSLVLAGEVIEHLSNPGLFLQGVRRLLAPGGALLLTTVNAYCGMRMGTYGLRGRGGRQEPIHPDHVAYYSYSTLHTLLERHGYRVTETAFYDLGREHRALQSRWITLINDISVRAVPHWSDGIIVECRPA